MISVLCQVMEDGLLMASRPNFSPGDGSVIAHDILEHPVFNDDSVEHELMALGATVLTRNFGDYWVAKRGIRHEPVSLGIDIGDELLTIDGFIRRCPKRYRMLNKYSDEQDWLEQAAIRGCKEFEDKDLQLEVFMWLLHGYHTARKRFKDASPSMLLETYFGIENAVDDFLKYAAEHTDCRVQIIPSRAIVKVRYTKQFRYLE